MKKINLKIYFEDLTVNIVPLSEALMPAKNRSIYEGFKIRPTLLLAILESLKGQNQEIFITTADPNEYLQSFASEFLIIRAAGGLIMNEQGKYLMIFRNGKWDLPKGKMEDGESPEKTACREVNEECGIHISETKAFICNTYHIYALNGNYIFKETSWFLMFYNDSEELKPQKEEGITQVEWVSILEMEANLLNSYGNIKDVIHTHQKNI